ncbi:MAG: hypothetical protein JSV53_05600 [candidate division WOR-3 bacterium]|nr:MAG: hypothetical protein JSV53_05600 [candidate division WOR-3 bacterium]
MRKFSALTMFCVLMLLFCGAPQESPEVEAAKTEAKDEADFYYATLGESELQSLIKAMPVFKAEVEKIDMEMESADGPQEFAAMLGQYSTLNKRVPELDAKLRNVGMAWEEFWPALGKTYMAVGAVMMDSVMDKMKEEMQGVQGEMLKEMMKGMEEVNEVYKGVPQGNKDLVKRYMKELKVVME